MIGAKQLDARLSAVEKEQRAASERQAALAEQVAGLVRELGLVVKAVEISGPGGTLAELRQAQELAEAVAS
jgi:hypothetical protein